MTTFKRLAEVAATSPMEEAISVDEVTACPSCLKTAEFTWLFGAAGALGLEVHKLAHGASDREGTPRRPFTGEAFVLAKARPQARSVYRCLRS